MSRPILLVEGAPNDIKFALYSLKHCRVSKGLSSLTMAKKRLAISYATRSISTVSLVTPGCLAQSEVAGGGWHYNVAHQPGNTGSVIDSGGHVDGVSHGLGRKHDGCTRHQQYVVEPMDIQQFIRTMYSLTVRYIKH